MSKGPAGVTDHIFEPKCYLHLHLTPKDWCTYKGVCRVGQLALRNGACDCCQYKKRIDVPMILERLHNERIECDEAGKQTDNFI